MKHFLYILFAMVITTACQNKQNLVKENFDFAEKQTKVLLTEATPKMPLLPRTVNNNTLVSTDIYDWVSGFFPGSLWYLYEYTKADFWKGEAEKWTALLEPIQYFYGHHDIGFMMQCSYGNGYRLTKNAGYKDVLINTAKSLSNRYNATVGSIQSWDIKGWQAQRGWMFPVIIDNMMNLELLFNATKLSGDSSFYKMAVSHADVTMNNHYRPDYSSYHVVDYDPATGKARNHHTAQGYAHESAWARGQAWGLYGFTTCYRETGYERFLNQAENIAAFIMNNPKIPTDLVPYWDYNAPNIPNEPRDVSAASITASALLQLAAICPNAQKAGSYKAYANRILESLSSPAYRAELGKNHGFLLMHSVGSIPHGSEIDTPLNYADYYFLEALLKK